MDVIPQLVRAATGGRARSGGRPDPARLERLRRAVERGEYDVPPDLIADALLRAMRGQGPRAPRD